MSGYRDDTESLKAEIARLRAERASIDRRLGLGPHAPTPLGRAGYRLGRRLARRLARRRPAEPAAQALRARRAALAYELAALERQLAGRARGHEAPDGDRAARAEAADAPPREAPNAHAARPGWAERAGRAIAGAWRRWRRR